MMEGMALLPLSQGLRITTIEYLDNVQDLLLNHQLATHPTIEVQELARALTLATVKNLDPVRKGI